jgi:hypothetical protein
VAPHADRIITIEPVDRATVIGALEDAEDYKAFEAAITTMRNR